MTNSKAEEHTGSENEDSHRIKRRKGPKACDVCRRKKIRCNVQRYSAFTCSQPPVGDAFSEGEQHPCVNCAIFKTECTYTYVAKKRRTQQAFIDQLQGRLSKLESLVLSLAPDIDLAKELDDKHDVPSLPDQSSTRSPPRPPSPLKSVSCIPINGIDPTRVVAAFTDWREHSLIEDSDEDDVTLISVPAPPSEYETKYVPHRFHGKSSGVMLLQKVMGLKRTYTGGDGTSALHTKSPVPEEAWDKNIHKQLSKDNAVTMKFPPQDLLEHLIDVFFRWINPYMPLLHRPSFEAKVRNGLHTRDEVFGAVVLLVCAAASRCSDDPRVLSQAHHNDGSWYSAGWDYYYEVKLCNRHNFLHGTSVQDLQVLALASIYLCGISNPSPSWQLAGLGVRLALDVGAHRKKKQDNRDVLDIETWKRAFWVLVALDRVMSAALGRPCAIWEEDIDVDLPLEVDDEYLTEGAGFKQPPDTPSYISCFNLFVKLSQILIGALRTIYPISKNKSMHRVAGPNWEQDIVAALDSSLNSWVDSIPEHLRWNPKRLNADITFYQSAMIQCYHSYVQIVVHRPYITKASSSSLALPSLAICTNAARSCAHTLDEMRRRGPPYLLPLNHGAFTSAVVLLFNIWGTNKSGARVDWQSHLNDVHICMQFIKLSSRRWQLAQRMESVLFDLVCDGDFPLPQECSPPHIPGGSQSGQKRSRPSNDADTSPSTTDTCSGSSSVRQSTSHISGSVPFSSPDENGFAVAQDSFDHNKTQVSPSYYPVPPSTLALETPTLPAQSTQMEWPVRTPFLQQAVQPVDNGEFTHHSAHDVLTALDSAYLVGYASSYGDANDMDAMAQQTIDMWGSGLQWDGWPIVHDIPNMQGSGTGWV